MQQIIDFNLDLIKFYDTAGPRYTSYPTAVEFDRSFDFDEYRHQIIQSNKSTKPLSLYIHIPFCDTVCFYCACIKVVTKNRERAAPYLDSLHTEIAMQALLVDPDRQVEQLHWGGGTPTFISHHQMRDLMAFTRHNFNLVDDDTGEFSIEIDPREADAATITVLREIGFNRLSIGVQDLDPEVQKAVNRIQSKLQTLDAIKAAKDNNFHSISIDLIYGLPKQTETSFAKTLEHIIEISPDRISLFNYAHMPERFKVQRQIKEQDLPSAQTKLNILQQSINALTQSGYVYIGMDHFAKPNDTLAVAQRENKLYRNFQGYSTHANCDLIGMGVTAISSVGDCYMQNQPILEDYSNHINAGQLAIFKGLTLSKDDKLRSAVINQLICHFELDIPSIEQRFGIRFNEYFRNELSLLNTFIGDGLVLLDNNQIKVTPTGRLLIRNICMVFDYYLQSKTESHFSKVI